MAYFQIEGGHMSGYEIYSVGIFHFASPFGDELVSRLNNTDPFLIGGREYKIVADDVKIHEFGMEWGSSHQLIIDRGSHVYQQARNVFKMLSFRGVHIINNPYSFEFFMNKDVGYYYANMLGVPVPPTYSLPPHDNFGFTPEELRNNLYFDWDKMIQDVGFPMFIKPSQGRGGLNTYEVRSYDELISYYNRSGDTVMSIQKKIDSDKGYIVRTLCIGKTIIPIKYIFRNPDGPEYIYDDSFLSKEEGKRVIDYARIINFVFGYKMNSVEFILKDEVPWAIDFNNPVPDGRREALGEVYFDDYQKAMVRLVLDIAKTGKKAQFLPPVNKIAELARLDIPACDKREMVLKLANEMYYEGESGDGS